MLISNTVVHIFTSCQGAYFRKMSTKSVPNQMDHPVLWCSSGRKGQMARTDIAGWERAKTEYHIHVAMGI